MIEVTEEYVRTFRQVAIVDGAGIAAALAAVLQLVDRDRQATPGPDRCSDCGRTARELRPWHERINGRATVVARLGPGCYKRRLAAAMTRTALPIGGEP